MRRRARTASVGLGVLMALLAALPAQGAPPPVRPTADDLGALQWSATAEIVAVDFYDAALRSARTWRGRRLSVRDQATLVALRAASAAHLQRLRWALQGDAPKRADFTVVLPANATASRAGTLAFAARFERLLAGVSLTGVSNGVDPGSRVLLGRLLAQQAQHVQALAALIGRPAGIGLLNPVGLERAGAELDRYVRPGASAPPTP